MRPLILLSTALVLASCARPGTPGSSELFARELAGRAAGAPQTCINTLPAQNLRAIDDHTIAYDRGTTIYVNRLLDNCPSVGPHNTLIVQASIAGQYCRGDQISGNEPGGIIAGPACNLQDWVPYKRS